MQILETQRLKLLPFTLELKRATLAERARLAEMLEIEIPDAWPGADMLEALPFFIEVMEQDPAGLVWDGIILHKAGQEWWRLATISFPRMKGKDMQPRWRVVSSSGLFIPPVFR